MKYRAVTSSEIVGVCDDFRSQSATIFRCALECGHFATVMTQKPPLQLDCMNCADHPIQLMLPLEMPPATRNRAMELAKGKTA